MGRGDHSLRPRPRPVAARPPSRGGALSRRAVARWDGLARRELARRWRRPAADVHLFGRIDSTNQAAKELADAGAAAGTLVLCREQTSGRGQGGREWISPPGTGLYLSLVLRPSRLPNPTLVPLLAGLAVAESLSGAFPGLETRVRWPNDVMLGEGKCAGVLSEATWVDGAPRHLVVGVGVNVKPLPGSAPPAVRRTAVSLHEVLEARPELVEVADAVVAGLDAGLADPPERLDASRLEALDRLDWLRDRRVRLLAPGDAEGTTGRCVGIAPDGALLFRPDRGALRRVKSARVEVEP